MGLFLGFTIKDEEVAWFQFPLILKIKYLYTYVYCSQMIKNKVGSLFKNPKFYHIIEFTGYIINEGAFLLLAVF